MSTVYNKWEKNGVTVIETDLDYDLHQFYIYHNSEFVGCVIPASIEDCTACRDALERNGADIVTQWDDGLLHGVSLDTDSDFFRFWNADDAAVTVAIDLFQEVTV